MKTVVSAKKVVDVAYRVDQAAVYVANEKRLTRRQIVRLLDRIALELAVLAEADAESQLRRLEAARQAVTA